MKGLMLSLLCSLLIVSNVQAGSVVTPVEQKVVEIHMTGKLAEPVETKKRRESIKQLPLDRRGTCSGAFVDAFGDIVTARHCVDKFDSFEVETYDKKLYTAYVVAVSGPHDLALIHIDKLNTPYFKIAADVKQGEEISILGSPLGITGTLSKGVVARLDGDITLLDCSVLPGNSGGPVFNSEGELVGVVTAGFVVMSGMTHLNLAQSIDTVLFFIVTVLSRKG